MSEPQYKKLTPISAKQFADVVDMIRKARSQVLRMTNATLIEPLRQYLSAKIASAEWGDGMVNQLAVHIGKNCPEVKGFSDKREK